MTPEERDIIAGLFDKMRSAGGAYRDPEAERFIAEQMRAQPYAPYVMAQTVYAQDMAMRELTSQVEALQAEIEDMREQLQRRPTGGGGFLSGIFGGGRQDPEPRRPMGAPYDRGDDYRGYRDDDGRGRPMGAPPLGGQPPYGQAPAAGGPFGGRPQGGPWAQQPPPARGGGFLAGAASTAMGVAGGMLIANALGGLFGGDEAKAAAPTTSDHPAADTSSEQQGDWQLGGDGGAEIDDSAFFDDI